MDLLPKITITGNTDYVNDIEFSPDGNYLLTGCDDNKARLWSVSDGSLVATLKYHDAGITSVSFSPDGKLLATAGSDGRIIVWEPNQ